MSGYKDLEIYKLSHKLAIDIHKMSKNLPKIELFEEGQQIRRSSKSVAANIVEGFGRKKYQAEYQRFLIIAHASCNETIEHLELLWETESLTDRKVYDYLFEEYNLLGRKLNKFIQAF